MKRATTKILKTVKKAKGKRKASTSSKTKAKARIPLMTPSLPSGFMGPTHGVSGYPVLGQVGDYQYQFHTPMAPYTPAPNRYGVQVHQPTPNPLGIWNTYDIARHNASNLYAGIPNGAMNTSESGAARATSTGESAASQAGETRTETTFRDLRTRRVGFRDQSELRDPTQYPHEHIINRGINLNTLFEDETLMGGAAPANVITPAFSQPIPVTVSQSSVGPSPVTRTDMQNSGTAQGSTPAPATPTSNHDASPTPSTPPISNYSNLSSGNTNTPVFFLNPPNQGPPSLPQTAQPITNPYTGTPRPTAPTQLLMSGLAYFRRNNGRSR